MSVVGNWDVSIQSPFGEQVVRLEFPDEYTGVASYGTESIPLARVSSVGDYASWTVSLSEPIKVTLSCTTEIHGDSMSGTASAGFFGKFALRGIRTAQ